MALTAAGLLLPAEIVASPEKRIWQLDQTQLGQGALASRVIIDEAWFDGDFQDPYPEIVWVSAFDGRTATVIRGQAGTSPLLLRVDPGCPVHTGDYLRVDAAGTHLLGISGPVPSARGFQLGRFIPRWDESLE